MNSLEYDIIEKILFKIHRFKYLGIISKINKDFNKSTKNILNFHYDKLNKALKDDNKEIIKSNIYLYNTISKYLFNYKILNFKYYNFYETCNISNFIKIIILYDEICSTKKENLLIIKYKNYQDFLKNTNNNYIPFMILYIKTGYSLHFEYSHILKSYRMSINNPVNKLSLSKIINLEDIIKIISLSQNSLFSFIYKSYLLKFFKK